MGPVRGGGDGLLTASTMEDEDDLFTTEYPVSASEDEGEDNDDSKRKHQKLLEAISSLDGKKRRKVAERTEAGLQVSEFGISSEGAGKKISLSDVIQPQTKAAPLSNVKKQLDQLKQKKTVDLPLNKAETEKIQRIVSYQAASREVAKWEPVVKEIQKAEQLVFPLSDEKLKPTRIEDVVTGWTARTPLEMEIFNILHKNKQPITDPLLTRVEKASLKAMSLEEAKLRRAELQKARALQSYYEAKARRAKKIKSKTYHKHLKKDRRKDLLKKFEELRKSDPEAALEELEKIDKARIAERMSLKHQNSGKWAKSKAIMAKYDDEARKAIQVQLQKNKDLTLKIPPPPESEDESEKEAETVPDFVNEAQEAVSEGPNPWMTGKLRPEAKDSGGLKEEEEEEVQMGEELGTKAGEEVEEEEEEESEEEALLKEFEDKRRWRKEESAANETGSTEDTSAALARESEEKQVLQFNLLFEKLVEQNRKEGGKREAAAPAEEEEEEEIEDPVQLQPRREDDDEEGPLLMESLERKRSLEEVEALGREERIEETITEAPTKKKKKKKRPAERETPKESKLIDHNDILPAKAKRVRAPVLPTVVEGEEEEEEEVDDDAAQKMIIQEAFAGDDVISDFMKEKRKAEEAGKPKDINLVLPGWGEWGGTGLKVSKKKRRKFFIKAPPGPPRKDQRLPTVIINEKRNVMAAGHQVSVLPFPFNNREQFESSIRLPVGNTWNTEKSVLKLTAPKVITKKGHIIEPITRDDFQKHARDKKAALKRKAKREGKKPGR